MELFSIRIQRTFQLVSTVNMTIQTQAFTPPEFQPLKICTYKPTSKAKNKYFKLINT